MVHDCVLLGLAASIFVVTFFLILESFMQINHCNEAELMHFKSTHLSPRKKKNIYTPKLSKSDGCIASAMFFLPLA